MPTAYFFRTNSRTCQSFLFGLIWLVIEFRSKRNYNQLREGTSNFNSQKLSTEKKYFDILDKTSQKFSNFVLNLLRVGWYSSPCLAPCLTIHPLSDRAGRHFASWPNVTGTSKYTKYTASQLIRSKVVQSFSENMAKYSNTFKFTLILEPAISRFQTFNFQCGSVMPSTKSSPLYIKCIVPITRV